MSVNLKRIGHDERGAASSAAAWAGSFLNDDPGGTPEAAEVLAGAIDYAFNPPDGDGAAEAGLVDAVLKAMRFIEDQACTCVPDDDPCPRCEALGRFQDEREQR